MAMPLGMVARWQIIWYSCKYMHTSNLDMVLFTIEEWEMEGKEKKAKGKKKK